MGRVKTFSNGGSLLPGDLNSIEDDYEFAFSTYKTLLHCAGNTAAAPAAATLALPVGNGGSVAGSATTVAGTSVATAGFYFDPADFLANTRTTKLKVRAQVFTNAVAPTTTWTVGLYPISTYGGASGATPQVLTVGAVTAGSTVAVAAPGATSQTQGNSGDFTMPTAGYYLIAVVNSGAAAAGSIVGVTADLLLRQV